MRKMNIAILLVLLLFAGCDVMGPGKLAGISDTPGDECISVSIVNQNGVKVYSESLPLINVMHLREVTTDQYNDFTFNYSVPGKWGLVFDSESISFSCVNHGSVQLNWSPNTYYSFAITTEELRLGDTPGVAGGFSQ